MGQEAGEGGFLRDSGGIALPKSPSCLEVKTPQRSAGLWRTRAHGLWSPAVGDEGQGTKLRGWLEHTVP